MDFETVAGIYVYCADYHGGQWSRLYRLMSRIRMTLPDSAWKAIRHGRDDRSGEWEQARKVYRTLKRRKAE
jgi:hypothetical protein